jgi:hypothetical protein
MISFKIASAWARSRSVSSMGLSRESSSNLVLIGLRVLWTATGSTMCHLREQVIFEALADKALSDEPIDQREHLGHPDLGREFTVLGLHIEILEFLWDGGRMVGAHIASPCV